MSVYSTVGVAVERFISVCLPHSQVQKDGDDELAQYETPRYPEYTCICYSPVYAIPLGYRAPGRPCNRGDNILVLVRTVYAIPLRYRGIFYPNVGGVVLCSQVK